MVNIIRVLIISYAPSGEYARGTQKYLFGNFVQIVKCYEYRLHRVDTARMHYFVAKRTPNDLTDVLRCCRKVSLYIFISLQRIRQELSTYE